MLRYKVCTEEFEFNKKKFDTPKDAWEAMKKHDNVKVVGGSWGDFCDNYEEALKTLNGSDVQRLLSNVEISNKLVRSTVAYIVDEGEPEIYISNFSYATDKQPHTMEEWQKRIAERKAEKEKSAVPEANEKSKVKTEKDRSE